MSFILLEIAMQAVAPRDAIGPDLSEAPENQPVRLPEMSDRRGDGSQNARLEVGTCRCARGESARTTPHPVTKGSCWRKKNRIDELRLDSRMSASCRIHEADQMTVILDLLNSDPRTKMRPDKPRHPEKAKRPDTPLQSKPAWIRVKAPGSAEWAETKRIVRENKLVTVCEEASCPNIGECWAKKHATFMIMGDTCTRACAFCNVRTGLPGPLDTDEPVKVAEAVAKLGLEHVVVTSVDRDDLADGGAAHFAATIAAIRAASPGTTVEILTPDFLRKTRALETVIAAKPDVFNHNLETVPSKYLTVRPGARYFHSVRLLQRVKELDAQIFTKSGIMVGLGEDRNEVLQLMDDLRSADVDFLTIGQYLQPTRKHHEVVRFVPPDEFKALETVAYAKGFLMVSASPLTRSSHHAGDDFARLKAARDAVTAPLR